MKYKRLIARLSLLRCRFYIAFALAGCSALLSTAASANRLVEETNDTQADETQADETQADETQAVDSKLNLSPEIIEQSPVLQRWLESVPNISEDIRNDPSFVTRVQAGYSYFPSSDSTIGFVVGIEDLFIGQFIGQMPLTVSADYQQNFRGDRQAYGADLHYYVLPLGGYVNLSPIAGYRYAKAADDYSVSGANLGVRLRVVPSRTGAADLTIDQSWIVGDSERLRITQVNVGYALRSNLRLSTDLEWQSTKDEGDSRVGVNLEWVY